MESRRVWREEDPESAFMGFFRRNDQATIQIMAKAATIVPKACDILGISLSDSESEAEDENDDTAEGRGERSPQIQTQSHHHRHRRDHRREEEESESSLARIEGEGAGGGDDSINSTTTNVDNHQVQEQEARPKPHFRARLLTPTRAALSGLDVAPVLGSHVRKSRKRCASTPSPSTLNLGQSTSNSEGLRGLNPPTNKKRRFPSISFSSGLGPESSNISANETSEGSADFSSGLGADQSNINPAWATLSVEEYAIRKRMMKDMELLQEQLSKLAELEKQQYALMQRYLQVEQQQQVDWIQPDNESSAINNNSDDGTNVSTTATNITITTTTTEELEMEASNNEDEDMEENVNIINDAEIFTDAEINIGQEVVVDTDGVEIDQEIGSLM